MAFDGIVISNIVSELKQKLTGGRISKIAQPEPEELVLTIKTKKTPTVCFYQQMQVFR